jgi:hypothetical protein
MRRVRTMKGTWPTLTVYKRNTRHRTYLETQKTRARSSNTRSTTIKRIARQSVVQDVTRSDSSTRRQDDSRLTQRPRNKKRRIGSRRDTSASPSTREREQRISRFRSTLRSSDTRDSRRVPRQITAVRRLTTLDLAGSGANFATSKLMKRLLDRIREKDA